MGKIRRAILNKEKEEAALKIRKAIPRKEEEWDVTEEGFHKDEVEDWNERRGHMLLDPSADIEPASFSEDSETEVLPLDLKDESGEDSFEDEEGEMVPDDNVSDIFEASDSEAQGPSDKAWGKRKSSFYDTGFVGDDDSLDSSEESLAEEEEREAVSLQRRLMESLDYADYGIDSLQGKVSEDKTTDKPLSVKKSLSDMSESEKLALLNYQWPEFMELYTDYGETLTFIKEKIDPLVGLVSTRRQCFTEFGAKLILAYKHFSHLYCTNIMLYLAMRASQLPAEEHPIIKRIVELREVLGSIRTGLGDVEELMDVIKSSNVDEATNDGGTIVGKRELSVESDEVSVEDPLEYYERVKAQKKKKKRVSFTEVAHIQNEDDGMEEDGTGKRGITYQISQNKGLTPKRKKELRNPRVKHRKKFVKSVKKYQKVVRPVERELARYGGERGGIKSRLSRSVKLK